MVIKESFALQIHNLSVSVFDKTIVHNIDLSLELGSIHAIMGPNGSGKSSLVSALAGHPEYIVDAGLAMMGKVDLLALPVHERARHGLFLSFQNPPEIPGVSVFSFLRASYEALKKQNISVEEFTALLHQRCEQLHIDQSFLSRGLNDGFSGGEKKRFELLQLLVLQPNVALLDEIDSGLDIDALKTVACGLQIARQENPLLTIVLITHYRRILDYIQPDHVHVLYEGRFVTSGDFSLVNCLESEGYDVFKQ